jgi:hypothetical protein
MERMKLEFFNCRFHPSDINGTTSIASIFRFQNNHMISAYRSIKAVLHNPAR